MSRIGKSISNHLNCLTVRKSPKSPSNLRSRQIVEQITSEPTTQFSGTDKTNHDEGNVISREVYPGGYTLYAFDLTPDLSWTLQPFEARKFYLEDAIWTTVAHHRKGRRVCRNGKYHRIKSNRRIL